MEFVVLLVAVACVAALAVVAHRLHAARHWTAAAPAQTEDPPPAAPVETSLLEVDGDHEPPRVQEFVQSYVDLKWREGFLTRDEIVELAADAVEDEFPGADAIAVIERSVDRAADLARREQATWPATTDCDRLTSVFAALDAVGIVAAENFSCCNNCGHGEMMAEVEQEKSSRPVRGYVFYHAQDTERAAQGEGLHLRYGHESDDEADSVAVGRLILDALTRAGFSPQWNGSSEEAIFVPITWQKRRAA